MEIVELDKLIICLEKIVHHFDFDIIDFSYDLMIQLVNSYLKLIEIDPDEDNHEAEIAASCCLKAIQKILKLSTRNPSLYEKVERVVFRIKISV